MNPFRAAAVAFLGRIGYGTIEVVDGGRRFILGGRGPGRRVTVVVHSPRLWRSLFRGSTGLAESYMLGEWDCDDLVGLATVAGHNLRQLDRVRRPFHRITGPFQRLGITMPRTTRTRGRRQIAAHYDLGNDLFSLFLDRSMNYSSAVYEHPDQGLEDAQLNKMDGIARRLELGPEHHLLEIGTGWGGLAVHLARETGCRVTTTTISKEQAALARERVDREGLSDRIRVTETDYRDLTGTYDRLVSVEMIEAVGWKDFPTFFRKCSSLLAADGLMFLQSIVIDDEAYELEKASRSFISHFIFPGGCLPSVAEIERCLSAETDLRTTWIRDITGDYARTLAEWRHRFLAAAERLEDLGYDERFRRMWILYLCVAEGGFRSGRNSDAQMLMAKAGRPSAILSPT
jgi:cyclopropane-fatty-acyl-phospholipid synthase